MSALLVEAETVNDMVVGTPTRPQPGRWRHVGRAPQARPALVVVPGGRPQGVPAPQLRCRTAPPQPQVRPAASGWQLTERGIAVVVMFFLAVVATAAVVLVTSFLSVSNAPLPAAAAPAAASLAG